MARHVESLRKVLFLKDTVGKKWLLVPELKDVDTGREGSDTEVMSGSTFGKKVKYAGEIDQTFSFSTYVTSETAKKFSTENLKDFHESRTTLEGIVGYLSNTALASVNGTQLEATIGNLLSLTDHKAELVSFQISGYKEDPANYEGGSVLGITYTCSVQDISRISAIPTIA